MTEHQPAVEFADQGQENEGGTGWWGLTAVTLTFTAITIALAIPGVWDEYIVRYESRRYRGVVNLIESIGYWPIIITTAIIALAAGVGAVMSFLKAQRNTKD
ncbi:MAG: hypothetical protein K4304_11135 [Propionicimonas sp.]